MVVPVGYRVIGSNHAYAGELCEHDLDLPQVIERIIHRNHCKDVRVPHIQHGEEADPESEERKDYNENSYPVIFVFYNIRLTHEFTRTVRGTQAIARCYNVVRFWIFILHKATEPGPWYPATDRVLQAGKRKRGISCISSIHCHDYPACRPQDYRPVPYLHGFPVLVR